jgi:LacI family transcriptional regulator, gluconate utilization system Gnt-I transcriptional repressor
LETAGRQRASCGNYQTSNTTAPTLSPIRFPRYEIGRCAANMLIDRVSGKSSGPATVDLGFQIIERESG